MAQEASRAVLERLAALRAAREHWTPVWRELSAQIMPRKGANFPGQNVRLNDEAVFDSTPAHSWSCSPRPWAACSPTRPCPGSTCG